MNPATLSIIVQESSQIGEARRAVTAFAEKLGFDATDAGRVALAVAELGTNLVKHTGGAGGELLYHACRTRSGPTALQVFALDRGPGIANLPQSFRDGYSTSATAGEGLGTIRRAADTFDVYSQVGQGTALFCEFRPGSVADDTSLSVGGVSVPLRGEPVCGDAWQFQRGKQADTLLMVDGLGHGAFAFEAAVEASRAFEAHHEAPLASLFEILNATLKKTRGGAISVSRIPHAPDSLSFAGIGNVAGGIWSEGAEARLVSMNGIVGSDIRKVKIFHYPFLSRSTLFMHTDGLTTKASLGSYPGLASRSAALIASVLFRDYRRTRDDATVAVFKGPGWGVAS